MAKHIVIDSDLHTQLRIKAIHEGKSLQALTVELLKQAIR